jgi:transposase InsO family protein
VSFKLADEAEEEFPVHRLCRVLGVSQSGYVAWKGRPACRRQHEDMVLLAHIRPAALSNGTYGSPRMTRDLCDDRLLVGRRRTARLMRENGLRARQKRRFTRTTDSQQAWPVAPNLLDQAFTAAGPDEKWGPTSPTSGRRRAGCTSPSSSTCLPAASSAGRPATGYTATWPWPRCGKPSSCAVQRPAWFITRTVEVNIVSWATSPN